MTEIAATFSQSLPRSHSERHAGHATAAGPPWVLENKVESGAKMTTDKTKRQPVNLSSASFKMRARTVDHLGREQIADCPTAISELWKNAYDAYARNVRLDIIEREEPVAVLSDDGHGMSREDFDERWLVIGTESKLDTGSNTPVKDRNGLPLRTKQGQKGIGRLSSANLGPLLLLISKRKGMNAIAALIDWRLFENPFLNLSDIVIPTVDITAPADAFEHLEALHELLLTNIDGEGRTKEVRASIRAAWNAHDRNHSELHNEYKSEQLAPSEAIKELAATPRFQRSDLEGWNSFGSDHGTILLVSGINYDLECQLADEPLDDAQKATRDRFRQTLSSFVDPYSDGDDKDAWRGKSPDFQYSTVIKRQKLAKVVLGTEVNFSRRQIEPLEHCIKGVVNEDGSFVGRVKVFGAWLPDAVTIPKPANIRIPDRSDTRVGSFLIYISTFEQEPDNTTHKAAEHKVFLDLAERFAGFMIFRDGLRVLPYGRPDNDFFEIESRRSLHAGREFWNHRRMFGRIAIERNGNPNLRDKAGREGLLDNTAAKAFKEIVDNILKTSARSFFGTDSKFRKQTLPELKTSNKAARAREAKQKLLKRQREHFAAELKQSRESLPALTNFIGSALDNLEVNDDKDLLKAREQLQRIEEGIVELEIEDVPRSLGSLKHEYSRYREDFAHARSAAMEYRTNFEEAVAAYDPFDPSKAIDDLSVQLSRSIQTQLAEFSSRLADVQRREYDRMRLLAKDKQNNFDRQISDQIQLFKAGQRDYLTTTSGLEGSHAEAITDNRAVFEPYLRMMEALSESIDLESLATSGMEEVADARRELERINALAQLGIAVEITGHDLEDYDQIISTALERLPDTAKKSKSFEDLRTGVEGLTDHLRFLSPLRLAGQRVERQISGDEISEYLMDFFAPTLARTGIDLDIEDRFKTMTLLDRPSRIMPAFINLVNNSIYWTALNRKDGKISIYTSGSSVVVADNGPGVEEDDIDSLFSLFFTRKARGGRGVGLYLARANLTAGGHSIRYKNSDDDLRLQGAAFVIDFTGAEFEDE